ncbi:MAG: GNAT family N-acetyltransferase [Syntrophorhabdales bacterium]|jgi:ribosomal protein S18 acetylase RimI-like enzyme
MDIIELDRNRLPEIEDLWKELNSYHSQRSSNFKQYFDTLTFQGRIKQLLYKENLSLFVSSDADLYVGYCVVTAERNKGEIDSIYVKASHRGQGIGHELMTRAMEWLRMHDCPEIVICVAQGNEAVLSFYEKYGFSKRYTVMGKRDVVYR